MMPVEPASSPSGVFLLSEAFSFEKAPEQVPSELPKVSETFLICPLMLGPTSRDLCSQAGSTPATAPSERLQEATSETATTVLRIVTRGTCRSLNCFSTQSTRTVCTVLLDQFNLRRFA